MANGLMGLSNLLGQSSNATSGLFGSGVFSQPESRGNRRSRLLTEVLSSQPTSAGRFGAAIGGLLGMGARAGAERLGLVDAPPEVQRNQAIRQVQQEVAELGLDPVSNPVEFGEVVTRRFQELNQPELALRTQLQLRQMIPETTEEEIPAAFRNLQLRAEQAGLQPGTSEYAEFFRTGGRTPDGVNVTVEGDTGPQIGTIPAGYQLIRTEQGALRLEPIPGSEAAAEREQAEKQAEQQGELTQRAANVVFEDIDRLEELVTSDSILNPVLGIGGVIASQIPGTNRVNAEALSETIKANIGFDRLQQMREASPTGGALGQVSNQELNTLQSVLGNLSLSQSEDQIVRNLGRLRDIYSDILRKAQAYPNADQFGFGEVQSEADRTRFGTMDTPDLLNVDINSLSESELEAYNARLDALLGGGN